MANPTNISVPPALAANPTNINIPTHGSPFPSGATGADQCVTLKQGSNIGDAVTDGLVDSWIAPYDGYFRIGGYQTYSRAVTQTFRILNNTTSQAIVNAKTPVSNVAGALTFVAAGQQFAAGDEIRLLVTTSGGTGACKGLRCHLMYTPLAGTVTSPL